MKRIFEVILWYCIAIVFNVLLGFASHFILDAINMSYALIFDAIVIGIFLYYKRKKIGNALGIVLEIVLFVIMPIMTLISIFIVWYDANW